jgi:hypothetical protein
MKLEILVEPWDGKSAKWWEMKWISGVRVNGKACCGERHFTREEAEAVARIQIRCCRKANQFQKQFGDRLKEGGWTRSWGPDVFRWEQFERGRVFTISTVDSKAKQFIVEAYKIKRPYTPDTGKRIGWAELGSFDEAMKWF